MLYLTGKRSNTFLNTFQPRHRFKKLRQKSLSVGHEQNLSGQLRRLDAQRESVPENGDDGIQEPLRSRAGI